MHSATLKSDVTKGSCCHPFEQGDANSAWSELDKEKRACSVVLSFKDLLLPQPLTKSSHGLADHRSPVRTKF